MRTLPRRFAVFVLFLALSCGLAHSAEPYGVDLQGKPVQKLAGPDTKFVVLMFAASDCPICNRYAPEIARLDHEFASRGVRVWWVFPNPEDTASIVARHNQEFAIKERTVLDSRQTLVHLAHITVTPEAAIFRVDGQGMHQIYRGRVDNRYMAIGNERPLPDHHDLELALAAAVANEPVPKSTGPAVGCSVVFLQK
ncbi:MAG TPA: redoxin domain-containing protein [Terracidiphilus sp.]|nr:redoxin domain-containing protein [Terracidiphilus sp.]